MSIVSGTVHSKRTAVVSLHKRFSSDLAFSVIISALSWISRTLISAYLTLRHMSKNHSSFSSQFITTNIPSILIALLRFFTCTALGDVDLRFSLIFIPNPMMMTGGLHEMRAYITKHNQSKHVTDGVKVTSLSVSPQHKTSTATPRLCQIMLNQKLSCIVYAKSH